jgi:hypothetical protein
MRRAPALHLRVVDYRHPMFVLRAFSGLTGLALLASRIVCLIVIAWFAIFVVNQSKAAASRQLGELAGTPQQSQTHAPAKRSGLTKTLDEVARTVTTPFASITSGRSPWAEHGLDTLLALLVYGFGVGFIARLVRLRV